MAPVSLERALQQYSQNVTEKPFDIKTVPTIEIGAVDAAKSNDNMLIKSNKPTDKTSASRQDIYTG